MSEDNPKTEDKAPMKTLALLTSLLSLVSVWGVLLPMRFIYNQFPPDKTIRAFESFGARLPSGSALLLHNLTMGKLYVFALLLSAVIIWLGVRAQRNVKLFAGQAVLAGAWCFVVAVTLLWFFLPIFNMGEVVGGGGGYNVGKSEFTQIQFVLDSLYSPPKQLFMRRTGGQEVEIPRADGERWSNVEAASSTNRAFAIVYTDPPQATNTPHEQLWYRWPSRIVEMTLPMTNQPLTNYTIRTLWTCKPKADVVKGDLKPCYINPTWDGMYLMVDLRICGTRTNASGLEEEASCIYDVRQSKFVNLPPTAQ